MTFEHKQCVDVCLAPRSSLRSLPTVTKPLTSELQGGCFRGLNRYRSDECFTLHLVPASVWGAAASLPFWDPVPNPFLPSRRRPAHANTTRSAGCHTPPTDRPSQYSSSSSQPTHTTPQHPRSLFSRLQALGVAREERRLADVVQPAVQHHHALQAHPAPAVRRGAQLEAVDVGLDGVQGDATRSRTRCGGEGRKQQHTQALKHTTAGMSTHSWVPHPPLVTQSRGPAFCCCP